MITAPRGCHCLSDAAARHLGAARPGSLSRWIVRYPSRHVVSRVTRARGKPQTASRRFDAPTSRIARHPIRPVEQSRAVCREDRRRGGSPRGIAAESLKTFRKTNYGVAPEYACVAAPAAARGGKVLARSIKQRERGSIASRPAPADTMGRLPLVWGATHDRNRHRRADLAAQGPRPVRTCYRRSCHRKRCCRTRG
jgi:hypothetical protein